LNPVQRKQVKRLVAADDELKYYASGITATPFYGTSTGSTPISMITVAQNLGDNDRIGDSIKLKSLNLRMSLVNGRGATSNLYNDARLVVFQYKQTNSVTAPNLANMWLTGGATGNINVFSSRNIDFLQTYHVLYDRMIKLQGDPAAPGDIINTNYNQFIKVKVPLKYANKTIQYSGASVNCTNQIYFMVLGTFGTVATNPTFQADWDARYTDA
jgi:hypothetical protein